jgi:predicted transglutaminase-like cysteine proteinase
MLLRVAAGCFAALLMVWPAHSGLDSGTLDAFSPAAAAFAPADNQPADDPTADASPVEPDAKSETQIQTVAHDDVPANGDAPANDNTPAKPASNEAPAKVATLDPAEPAIAPPPPVAEPFGLAVAPVAGGDVAAKWSGVEARIRDGNETLARCRDNAALCPKAAQNFLDIVAQGRAQTGRARIGIINRAVNLAIEPMSDMAQWGVPDRWSPPLETFTTHRGDCEDYAIAKYVALTQAGVPEEDVKLIIVRNLAANEDHAVVAVRDEGNWIILDNRWLIMVEDVTMPRVIPLFVLDGSGVREFEPTVSAARRVSAPASLGL